MRDRGSNQVVIRLDQRLFYAVVAFFGIVALFGVGLYIGRLTSGGGRAAAPAAPIAQQQSQSPLALGQQLPQAGSQPVNPITSAQTGGQNPFQQAPGAQSGVSTAAGDPFGSDPRIDIPEIKAKAYTHDFGDVKPDQKVEKVLKLTNNGKSEMVIDNVTASCGCTAAVVSVDKVPPGGSTDLRVGYDPRVNKDAGKFITRKVKITYHFADEPGVSKAAEFTVSANVSN